MNGARCHRCGLFWAFSSGPHDNFSVITKFCPDCIGRSATQGWGLVRK